MTGRMKSKEEDSLEDMGNKLKTYKRVSNLVWCLMCMIGVSGFVLHSYDLISEFLAYPVVVDIDVQTGTPMKFPGVTVCSLSKYCTFRT